MYEIIEIESKNEIEQLGTKEKYWIYDEKEKVKKLFKIGRENTGEDWAEVFAYQLALIIDLPVAKYELARYKDKLGTISTNFVLDGERLIHGNELLVRILKDYPEDRFYKVREYRLETVLNLIQLLEKEKKLGLKNALYDFIGYLVFDCLIANQDRHHENWGFVVEKEQKLRLALSYDHASGFGGKVQEKEAKNRLNTNDKNYSVKAYCKKAKTPFYDKDLNKLSTLEACKIASKYDLNAFCDWMNKILKLDIKDIQRILDYIPDEFIKKYQKDFAIEILKENITRLEGLKKEICQNAR